RNVVRAMEMMPFEVLRRKAGPNRPDARASGKPSKEPPTGAQVPRQKRGRRRASVEERPAKAGLTKRTKRGLIRTGRGLLVRTESWPMAFIARKGAAASGVRDGSGRRAGQYDVLARGEIEQFPVVGRPELLHRAVLLPADGLHAAAQH